MLYPFFEWCEETWIGTWVRDSIWAFPVIESLHLVALCVLGGAILVVDMRMLGGGLKRVSIGELAGQARPWLVGGLVAMGTTGVLLFLSEAVKCYYSYAFWVKMGGLGLGLAFTFTVRERVSRNGGLHPTVRTRLVATASIAVWFTVAAAGRWIGFS